MTTPFPSLSAYSISPIDPASPADISSAVTMVDETFASPRPSPFQRAFYIDPLPSAQERATSYTRRLEHDLIKGGAKGWKAQFDGETVGVMVCQPPGVRHHIFDTSSKSISTTGKPFIGGNRPRAEPRDKDEGSETDGDTKVYEWIDPAGWNSLYGAMQDKRDELHKDSPGCWYLQLLAVHPSYQARGIGASLLTHLLSRIPPHLATHLESSSEGLKLYKKLGFEIIDQVKVEGRDGDVIEAPVLVKWGKVSREESAGP